MPDPMPGEELYVIAADNKMVTRDDGTVGVYTHKPKWRTILHQFGQNTTLHGVRQVTEPTPYPLRRLVWIFIVVTGFTLFVHQTVVSVLYYRSWPVAVNIKINYNETLRFPAVTICNQNTFRMTAAANEGFYATLDRVFSDQENNMNVEHEGNETDSNVTDHNAAWWLPLTELYNVTAHRKEDMIISCKWDNIPCGPTDFLQTLTDHGMCFTFNSGKDAHGVRHASQPGADWGLRLRINVEQYEYMMGPNGGAGVKVLVHDQNEVPIVSELGQAVAPGSHALLGIQVVHTHGLKPPHGRCNDDASRLTYFTDYSLYRCYTDCKQRYLIDACGCRHFYMPPGPHEEENIIPVCDLKTYVDCVKPKLEMFTTYRNACDCPYPCDRALFHMTITYGANSNFDMDKFLNQNTTDLQRHHVAAREHTQRLDSTVAYMDSTLSDGLLENVGKIKTILSDIVLVLDESVSSWSKYLERFSQRINFHMNRGLDGVKYCIVHDFIRGFQIIEERVVSYVPGAFYETQASLERVLYMLSTEWSTASELERKGIWFVVDDQLQNKKYMAERLLSNISNVNHAYMTGTRLLKYRATTDRRYDATFVPKHLIRVGRKERSYFNESMSRLSQYIDALGEMRAIGERAVKRGENNQANLQRSLTKFTKAAKKINYNIFLFRDRVVKKPLQLISKVIHDFAVLNVSLFSQFATVRNCVSLVNSLISDFKSGSWANLETAAIEYETYVKNHTTKKSHVATVFTSTRMRKDILVTRNFFSSLRSRGRDLTDAWRRLKTKTMQVYLSMVSEESTKRFYQKVHEDISDYERFPNKSSIYFPYFADLLRINTRDLDGLEPSDLYTMMNGDLPVVSVITEVARIESFFHKFLLSKTDIAKAIQLRDEEIVALLLEIQQSMHTFMEGNKIDYNFFRQNFLNLDVYIQELSYQQITQQRAYELTNLWSDIGGCIGLFVGASIITAFEVIDIFLHTALKMSQTWRETPQRAS